MSQALPAWLDRMAEVIFEKMPEGKIRASVEGTAYGQYRDDPAGFCRDVLDGQPTDDITRMMESVRDHEITIAVSGNAVGKSLPVATPVVTPGGMAPIGSLRVGDMVLGSAGGPVLVTGVFPQGRQPTYRVSFNDNSSILCSGDHLWATRSSSSQGRGRPYKVMSTAEIIPILHRHMHIPMCEAAQFEEKNLPVDPYVVGFLLGGGCLVQSVAFSSPDAQIIDRVKNGIPGSVSVKRYGGDDYAVTAPLGKRNPVLSALQQYGLIGKLSVGKFIPDEYLLGSVEQRKNLLAGLMDTDGTICKNSHCSYCTVSKNLAEQVIFLINSLGGTAKMTSRYCHYTYNGEKRTGQLAYNLSIKLPFCPFTLDKKAERWRDPATMQKQAHRLFEKIEYVGEMESVCIKVNAEDSLFLADNFIVTHNTWCAARVALWWYKSHGNAQVYAAAAPPMDNLERLLWGELSGVVTRNPRLFQSDTAKALNISRTPLDFIAGVTIPSSGTSQEREAKFSGKHSPNLLFILDEGDAIPDEVYRGIESCMSGGNVRLLVMFNPRQKSGHAYKLIQAGRANVVHLTAFGHPNVITGEDVIPGAVTRSATVRRINEWCRPAVPGEQLGDDEDTFDLPDYLAGATTVSQAGTPYAPLKPGRYVIMESAFSYMVLGRYPAQSVNQLISEAWIQRARARWDAHVREYGETPPVGLRPVLGLDVAEDGADYNVLYARAGGWVYRPSRWRGMDLTDTERRAHEEHIRLRGLALMVDSVGVGAGVAPHLREKGCNAHKVKSSWSPTRDCEFGAFKILRDQNLWAVREWLKADAGAMLPPEPLLLEELRVPTYETKGGKVRVMQKDVMKLLLGRSPNDLDALSMTMADAGTMLDPLDLEGVFQ